MRSHTDGRQNLAESDLTYSTDSADADAENVSAEVEFFTPPAEMAGTLPAKPDGVYITPDNHFKVDYFKANPPELRKSYTLITDLWRKKTTKYEDAGAFAKGVYGAVHKHTAKNNKTIVSKKSHEPDGWQSKKTIEKHLNMLDREVFFARELYPNENPYARFSWLRINPDQTEKEYAKLETRAVKPYVTDSMTFFDFTQICESIDDLALMVFFIMLEVERMHTKTYSTGHVGIVHGDLSGNNILVNHFYQIHLIDLAFASFVGEETFIFKMDNYKKSYMPKERTYTNKKDRDNAVRRSDTSHDIYTLAYNFKKAFDEYLKLPYRLAFYEKYPDIWTFVANSLADDPKLRPRLSDCIDKLKHQLRGAMLRKAVRTLTDVDLIDFMTKTNMHYRATDFNEVIFSFIEDEDFKTATKLVNLLQNYDKEYAQNHVARLLRIIPNIKVDFDTVGLSIESNDRRQSLTSELLTALEFARAVCKNPNTTLSSDLISSIRKHRRLEILFQHMNEAQSDLLRSSSLKPLRQSIYHK